MFKLIYWIAYIVLWPFYRFRFIGLENVPKGGCVICGNHTALIDSVLVILALGPNGNYAAIGKAELFKIPLLAPILRIAHVFPVKREENDLSAVKNGMKALKSGRHLVIFPEGTRVKKGKKVVPKSGAGMFALRTGSPMIPVFVPRGRKAFKRNTLIFGAPYAPEAGDRPGPDEYMAVTLDMMARIEALGCSSQPKKVTGR